MSLGQSLQLAEGMCVSATLHTATGVGVGYVVGIPDGRMVRRRRECRGQEATSVEVRGGAAAGSLVEESERIRDERLAEDDRKSNSISDGRAAASDSTMSGQKTLTHPFFVRLVSG